MVEQVDSLINTARQSMQSVHTAKQYGRMIERHLQAGGPPDVYLHDPGRWHSLLGLACHKGAIEAVRQLLDAGASLHWPSRAVSPKKLLGAVVDRESEQYDGLHLDPLGICMDAIGWSCMEANQWGRECDEILLHHDIDRQVECLKLLLTRGADPSLRDPAYRTLPMDAIMHYIQSKKHGALNGEVEAVFLDLITTMATARPSNEDTRAMAEERWADVAWMEVEWQSSFPKTTAKLRSWAQQALLTTLTPQAPAIARARF